MRFKGHIIILAAFLSMIPTSGRPAHKGQMSLMQPDGSTFTAVFKGDEFTRIKTTEQGHAIIQDSEGWWCYARYDDDGNKSSSGYKVGQETPFHILDQSIAVQGKAHPARPIRLRHSIPMGLKSTSSPTLNSQQTGTKHGLVIPAQFQDIKFVNGREDFQNMLMEKKYSRYGATGSAKDYFDTQFDGMVEFVFDVSSVVTLPGKREYYGRNNGYGNDSRPEEMVMDACRLAAQAGTDFSIYDDDNDGFVDNVFIFFAGEDEAEGADENSIWSHSWYLYSGAEERLQLDGKWIDRYACTSEMTRIYDGRGVLQETRLSGIGTFCHEYCHTFGLPDMYDTDYDNDGGWAAGLWGSTSIMDSGNQNNNGNTPPNFNAVEREMLGIANVKTLDDDGTFSLTPIHMHRECYRMETDREGEYFLFECRNDDADVWDAYIGGRGMLVYHIDKSEQMISRWYGKNSVNSDSSHQCADLVEADGRKDSFSDYTDAITRRGNISSIFFPYGQKTSLTPQDTPGLKFWNGEESMFSLVNITRKDNGSIEFKVIGGSEESTPPAARSTISHEAFYDGAIVNFESNRPFEGEATVRYGRPGQDTTVIMVPPYKTGKYSVVLEGLEPAKTYFVNISFELEGTEGTPRSISFMTKKAPSVRWSYIYFGNARRNSNGTFLYDSRIPLKVYNATKAKEITWTFNDEEITAEGDNYFSLPGSGTLTARIIWDDGSEEILRKEITISTMTIE